MHLLFWRPAPFRHTKLPGVGVGLNDPTTSFFSSRPWIPATDGVRVENKNRFYHYFLQCLVISRIDSFSINRT